mgnify:CR=1 FL=1
MSIDKKFEVIADAVYEKGIDDGVKAMWDAMTNKGTKTVGTRMFNETDFTNVQELPYTWKCTSGNMQYMFYNYQGKKLPNPKYVDLSYLPENNNANHTNSLCQYYSFDNCGIKDAIFPDYGIPASNHCESWFASATALGTIEVLRVHEGTTFKNTFSTGNATSMLNLMNITFEGVIGQELNMAKCPLLTDASLQNIAEHLKEFSSPNSAVLTLHATVKNRIEGTPIYSTITGKGWTIV